MATIFKSRVLCVDDDPVLLRGLTRRLRDRYDIVTAASGEDGLDILDCGTTIPVVISDMRMPVMDGAAFLSQVRERWPDSTRILLTGQADVQDTIAAVNHGSIFRFVTKPCPHDVLEGAIEDGIIHHELITAERDLLQNTLRGSVDLLTDVLSLVSPAAFTAAGQLKRYVVQMTNELGIADSWDLELAAMLSQIGCVTVPQDILEQVQDNQSLSAEAEAIYDSRWSAGQRLIANIPRLEHVAAMISNHRTVEGDPGATTPEQWDRVELGAQLLRIATDFDQLVARDVPVQEAIDRLRKQADRYDESLLFALKRAQIAGDGFVAAEVSLAELPLGAILDDDLSSADDVLLITKGQEITAVVKERLLQHARHIGINEPIRIRAPGSK